MEKKLNSEKNKHLEQQKKLENELNKIRTKSIKRNSIKNTKKQNVNNSFETYSNKINKKKSDNKIFDPRRTVVKKIKSAISNKKSPLFNSNRISWNKPKSDYAFGNI